jgi:hypothetical protein
MHEEGARFCICTDDPKTCSSVFLKELDIMFDVIMDKAVEAHDIIDFHEIMFKFTLDSFIA